MEHVSWQRPSVGRIVHYHYAKELPGTEGGTVIVPSEPLAAIITAARPDVDRVRLQVFGVEGPVPPLDEWVPFAAEPAPGYWSWPPRT